MQLLDKTDDKDHNLFWERYYAFMNRPSLLGHYVKLPDGTFDRITHQWETHAQAGGNGGSYYLASDGVSYSGGLTSGYPIDKLVKNRNFHSGNFWIFHHDWQRAHNGVYFPADCRFYDLVD